MTPSDWTITVITKDQEHYDFQLAGALPALKFTTTTLQVIITETIYAEFPLSDIARISYNTQSQTDIDATISPAKISYLKDGLLVISQLREGSSVSVFAVDGKLIRKITAHDSPLCLNLSTLSKGVYLVKADNITYKIMKR